MSFLDKVSDVLETAADAAVKLRAFRQSQAWMETEFRDMNQLTSTVQQYVYASSSAELNAMEDVLRVHIKSNAFNDSAFNHALWLFGAFHAAWTLRVYQQGR